MLQWPISSYLSWGGGGVPSTRRIDTTEGIKWGGDMTVNRTHSLDFPNLTPWTPSATDVFAFYNQLSGQHESVAYQAILSAINNRYANFIDPINGDDLTALPNSRIFPFQTNFNAIYDPVTWAAANGIPVVEFFSGSFLNAPVVRWDWTTTLNSTTIISNVAGQSIIEWFWTAWTTWIIQGFGNIFNTTNDLGLLDQTGTVFFDWYLRLFGKLFFENTTNLVINKTVFSTSNSGQAGFSFTNINNLQCEASMNQQSTNPLITVNGANQVDIFSNIMNSQDGTMIEILWTITDEINIDIQRSQSRSTGVFIDANIQSAIINLRSHRKNSNTWNVCNVEISATSVLNDHVSISGNLVNFSNDTASRNIRCGILTDKIRTNNIFAKCNGDNSFESVAWSTWYNLSAFYNKPSVWITFNGEAPYFSPTLP